MQSTEGSMQNAEYRGFNAEGSAYRIKQNLVFDQNLYTGQEPRVACCTIGVKKLRMQG